MSSRRSGQTESRPIKAITQTRLTQTIYKLLRTRIANHDFAPGERLQLDVLAPRLGVSRTPVREALNQLAAEGWVEIRPRYGTFVVQVDQNTVAELYQLRLMIDTSVGKLLAGRLMPGQTRTLARLVDKLARLVDGDSYVDYGAYLEAHRAFHSPTGRTALHASRSSISTVAFRCGGAMNRTRSRNSLRRTASRWTAVEMCTSARSAMQPVATRRIGAKPSASWRA
jgi:DNA-binding GntR family transcriptional regulator